MTGPRLTDAAAAALELIHCASLVHDDLPCFDDADHAARQSRRCTGPIREPLARSGRGQPDRAGLRGAGPGGGAAIRCARCSLIAILGQRTGMPGGICAGQGWESEAKVDLSAYHRAKTGALFIAATQMGAIAAGQDAEPWEELGARIGEAFQVADDLRDALCDRRRAGQARRAG